MTEAPFDRTTFEKHGPNAPALRYDPAARRLMVNSDHPFIDKLTNSDKQRNPARLFASSEVLVEGQLQDQGMDQTAITGFLRDRDRVLRLAAGDAPPTAAEVVRQLAAANRDSVALERAVGTAFRVLGFKYERKGGTEPGPDGVLYARLGRHRKALSDYRLVYDTKQTNQPSVPAGKIDLASLENFRKQAKADFGFFIATAYAAEEDDAGALNRKILTNDAYRPLTLLKVGHLRRLVRLHYRHGVTLTELRSLFEKARTTSQVRDWLDSLEESSSEARFQSRHCSTASSSRRATRRRHPTSTPCAARRTRRSGIRAGAPPRAAEGGRESRRRPLDRGRGGLRERAHASDGRADPRRGRTQHR